MAYRLADGNTVDDPTHVPTWDGLVGLLGRTDILYVADSKLCSRAAMAHIDSHGGRFVTVMPRTRTEDSAFRKHLQTHAPIWTQAARRPGKRLGDPDEIYWTTPAPLPSAEGYRIVWVHSTTKASRDAHSRSGRIDAGVAALEAPDAKLAGPRSRFKTRVAVEQAATEALADADADRWVSITVSETTSKSYKQARAGRPGPNTSYREVTSTRFTLSHDIRLEQIRYAAASDGCFPLITNDRVLSEAEILGAYRYQPNLERRHHLLKSVQDAAPVLLHSPARIEALFCCQFLALLISALIEREVRTGMQHADLTKIRLYPEFRNCTSPSTERILEIFSTVSRHQLHHDGTLVKTFHPELTTQQEQVLELTNLDPSVYRQPT